MFKELEQLIGMGLVKGGSLDNAIVMHENAIISKDGMRFPNELVRHKIMDMVGDIYLVGKRVRAHIIAVKPGHPTNVQLAKAMLAQEAAALKTTAQA
jgi:UDP-3-O-acyl-N-acetylglucosamine deacetylase